jgi:nucleotide-binding universal stress UspA family protein
VGYTRLNAPAESARSDAVAVERILCAVTDVHSAQEVMHWASYLRALFGAELRLFHALDPTTITGFDQSDDGLFVLNRLSALARRLPGRVSVAVSNGDATDEILGHARFFHADLIAVSTDTRDGSASPRVRHIAHEARRPVLAVQNVHTPEARHEQPTLREVLCAVDFAPASLTAAQYALAIGRRAGARVTILHVAEPCEEWEQQRELVEYELRQQLQMVAGNAAAADRLNVEIVAGGSPRSHLVGLASRISAGVIVMGVDAAQASLSEYDRHAASVMQCANCPVLMVPHPLFLGPRSPWSKGQTAA